MIFNIATAIIVALLAGVVGNVAASTVLAYASEGPSPHVLDKFVKLCTSLALVVVLVATSVAASETGTTENETITVIADVLGIIAMIGVLAFDMCTAHVLNTNKLHRLESLFDPNTPAIEPAPWLRAATRSGAVVAFAGTVLAVLL